MASYYLCGSSPTSGPRVVTAPSGHNIFYGDDGQRILCTDPAGTILHECQWEKREDGTIRLTRARVRLDSLLWIGVVPEATTHTSVLDVSGHPTRESMATEDLRRMAAQTWSVPLDDIHYFFPDSSFAWDMSGHVRIQLKKDGLFLLEDGTFASPKFISYMGAISWSRIDLLNVVELYQSTLPGTGSAVFELIWGLCDDQRQVDGPIPLRYRGLPTYPSEPAYGLFSAFFRPEAPNGENPHELFMDPQRTSLIAWWPRPDPPWRYFDRSRHLCVTVQGGAVQKVTVIDDPAGLPYVAPDTHGGFASCDRTVVARERRLKLRDGDQMWFVALDPAWGITHDTRPPLSPPYPFGWRAFFDGPPPALDPVRVRALALFYPDDETEVPELSSQPFVLEQVYASLNRLDHLPSRLAQITRVLIDGFDAVAAGCIDHDYTRNHIVLYRSPEWAQKQAQRLWDQAAQAGRLSAVRRTRFVPSETNREAVYRDTYDLIYCWIPFACYASTTQCDLLVSAVGAVLAPNGLALLAGPHQLLASCAKHALRVHDIAGVTDLMRLPLLTEHLRLHPRTHLNPALTVFLVEKR